MLIIEDNAIVEEGGGLLYDDISDLPFRAKLRLLELHRTRRDMTWEKAESIMIAEGLLPDPAKGMLNDGNDYIR